MSVRDAVNMAIDASRKFDKHLMFNFFFKKKSS